MDLTLFEQVELDLKNKLIARVEFLLSNLREEEPETSEIGNEIVSCGEYIAHIEEATIKYLMTLTNDYILSKLHESVENMDPIIAEFRKFGFDITSLDGLIEEIPNNFSTYNKAFPIEYSKNYGVFPTESQENVLRKVFEYFECPGYFPTVNEIEKICAMFGFTRKDGNVSYCAINSVINNSGFFDHLPVDDVWLYFKQLSQLDNYMTFYYPPVVSFKDNKFPFYIPTLEKRLDQIHNKDWSILEQQTEFRRKPRRS